MDDKPIEASKKKKDLLSKKTIDIIRTTQRNNIDLTAIADNKANVMLSLNALIIAALVPLLLANIELVFSRSLLVPLLFLATTCFTTMYIAAQVLKPSSFDDFRQGLTPNAQPSPFFFGNFYRMDPQEYFRLINAAVSEPEMIKGHLAQDLFYVGRRLGEKMKLVRIAYNIFIIGIGLTLASGALVLLLAD